MKCFDNDTGCLTDDALRALVSGSLSEENRLECAEHLSFCDECIDRYNELLEDDILTDPDEMFRARVLRAQRARAADLSVSRYAAAAAAFILAAGMWAFDVFENLVETTRSIPEIELKATGDATEGYDVLKEVDKLIASILERAEGSKSPENNKE